MRQDFRQKWERDLGLGVGWEHPARPWLCLELQPQGTDLCRRPLGLCWGSMDWGDWTRAASPSVTHAQSRGNHSGEVDGGGRR